MIAIKLDKQMINIFKLVSQHPILNRLMAKHEVDEKYAYLPEEFYLKETIDELISEGLAFRT